MRRFLFSLFALLLFASLAQADDWQKTYTISGTAKLRVDAKDGNVNLSVWDQDQINAHVVTDGYRIGEDGVRVIESQAGDSVEIDLKVPNRFCIGFCSRSVRIDLQVPRHADLDIHTGDGDVQGSSLGGDLRLTTGDGNVTLTSVNGRLEARSGDGNIRVGGKFDSLEINTGDGNVEASADSGSQISENWVLHSGDGNITLRLPQDFSADVDLRTGDGHIDLEMPVTMSGSLSRNWVHGKIGQGGGAIEVRTGDGSIRLEH